MGLFSKLKDYNSELEKILDNKYFSSSIKSLLFSMIYKLEISYVDFKEVKRCVRSKEDFLNEIIEIIRLYCDNKMLFCMLFRIFPQSIFILIQILCLKKFFKILW